MYQHPRTPGTSPPPPPLIKNSQLERSPRGTTSVSPPPPDTENEIPAGGTPRGRLEVHACWFMVHAVTDHWDYEQSPVKT
ncbi:hypothetical protein C0992_005909 [Termitomyces sp. T32_za158]|nr:hypothetical protein C0992_005909 [Termitomyces sp. T32_za158]